MKQNIPFFELDGKKYEIRRNRYIIAEMDNLKNDMQLSNEDQIEMAKEEQQNNALEKLSKRKEELYEKYLETFSEEDEAMYNKACAACNRLLDEIAKTKNILGEQANKMIDLGEKIILLALQRDINGDIIRSENEAKEIWEQYVTECGTLTAREFIVYTTNYILGAGEDTESPFVTQAKAKAEQRANMKKGISKVS